VTSIFRTAGCGPACPVVWEGIGRANSGRPYPDRRTIASRAILALVGMTACDGSSDPMSTFAPPDGLQSAALQLYDYEDAVTAAGDATLDGPMGFPADFPSARYRHHGPHAGPPLRALDLDPEQQEQILAAFESYRECLREPLAAFREANLEILQRAGQARQQILDDLRNELIDREEAMLRLRELSRATRAAIRNSPASATLRDAICNCREELSDAIREVLDDGQEEAWERWVSRHAGECERH